MILEEASTIIDIHSRHTGGKKLPQFFSPRLLTTFAGLLGPLGLEACVLFITYFYGNSLMI
jgi:hypothetical protein